VVVIVTSLGVSALPRYGKQGCLGKLSRASGSTHDAFCTTVWLGTTDNYRNLLDRLDLSGVVMALYGEHRLTRLFN